MFQVFHVDVTKVDRDAVYVAMVVHVCCMCLFPMFHLFSQTYVASVFIRMLHMFHTYLQVFYLDVAYIYKMFLNVFMCFCKCFVLIFQLFSYICCKGFHLDVLKVYQRVLCWLQCEPLVIAVCCSC
jgi:hypothetical protein